MAFETLYDKRIYFEENYYILFPDEKFKIKDGQYDEYYKIKNEINHLIPFYNPSNSNLIIELYEKIKKLNHIQNPNIRVMKGKELIEILKTDKYIPIFDVYFDVSKRLILIDIDFYETMESISLKNKLKM
jgi:hypothetical protein